MRTKSWMMSASVVLVGGLALGVSQVDELWAQVNRPRPSYPSARAVTGDRRVSLPQDESDEPVGPPQPYTRGGTKAAPKDTGLPNYKELFLASPEGQPATPAAPATRPRAVPTAARTSAPPTTAARPAAPASRTAPGSERDPFDDLMEELGGPADIVNADAKGAQAGKQVQPVTHSGSIGQYGSEPAGYGSAEPSTQRTLPADLKPSSAQAQAAAPATAEAAPAARPAVPAARPAARTAARPAARPAARVAERPAPASNLRPAAEARPAQAVATDDSISTTTAAATTQSPRVSVTWQPDREMSVAQESKCKLVVKNEGDAAATDLFVEAHFPKTVRLMQADPQPSESRDFLGWEVPVLAAGESKVITIVMMPMARGDVSASATVRFASTQAAKFRIDEPELKVVVKGPQEAMVGESATQIVSVTNSGTGVARDVVVTAIVPAGLDNPRGKTVEMPIGSLAAGETREVRLSLEAVSSGDHVVTIDVKGGGNLAQSAKAGVHVNAPKLEVAATGPSLRYLNRAAKYTLSVSNKGAAPTNNVRLMHVVPAGFEFIQAEGGGSYDATSRTVVWFVGRLEAGKTVSTSCDLSPKAIGAHEHRMLASGDAGALAEARVPTKVDGTSSLVMEVIDLDDPVEVGTETAYEIRIKNDGSKSATGINLSCELPSGCELIGTDGPVKHTFAKGMILFSGIGELAPGKSVTCRVKLKGKNPGQLKFRARLTSTSITEPISVDEVTRFYAD